MIHVHHLRVGRSVFTVWLLEELGLDYELTIYERDAASRAPPTLKEIHPLGKSPVIEDDGLVLAESGAIASYLIDKYDDKNLLAPARSAVAERAVWTQWLHYTEGSAFAPLLIKLLLMRQSEAQPGFLATFANAEVTLQLEYIEGFLGNKPFLLGDTLQAPDIGITYIALLAQRIGELAPYPILSAYLERNLARPGMQRAIERSGG